MQLNTEEANEPGMLCNVASRNSQILNRNLMVCISCNVEPWQDNCAAVLLRVEVSQWTELHAFVLEGDVMRISHLTAMVEQIKTRFQDPLCIKDKLGDGRRKPNPTWQYERNQASQDAKPFWLIWSSGYPQYLSGVPHLCFQLCLHEKNT